MTDCISAAIQHGWPLIKLTAPSDKGPSPGKKPVDKNWESKPGLTAYEAIAWLSDGGNLGIRTGDGLLVVDCDGDRPDGLPETPTVQTGSGGQHLYYRVPDGVTFRTGNTVRWIHPTTDTRGTGGQVVGAGSIHAVTGALYEWVLGMSPMDIPLADVPQWVIDAINDPATPPWKVKSGPVAPVARPARRVDHSDPYIAGAIAKAITNVLNAAEGTRNETLNREAYSLAGLPGVDPAQHLYEPALSVGLSEQESRASLASGTRAGREKPRTVPVVAVPAAAVTPSPAANLTDPTDYVVTPAPRELADKYLAQHHPHGTLRYWRGDWYEYDNRHYRVVSDKALRARVQQAMLPWYYNNDKGDARFIKELLKNSLISDVMGQLMQPGRTMIPDTQDAPMWLDGSQRPPARDWVSLQNGLLHLGPGREFTAHTPALFCTSCLPFNYDAAADSPEAWISFVTQTWPGDDGADCALLLGEWFGYCLSNDMSFHRMMWIIGPRRSGKGVISRILGALFGRDSTCNPTLGAFGDKQGVAVLIDKKLAIIGDARVGKRNDQPAIVERLLSISGGDSQTIARKYKDDWSGELGCKVLMLSNELPNLSDSSNALLGRLLLLQTTISHYGHEDRYLESKLRRELPGILNWALDGLDRLNAQGRFTEPAASNELTTGFRAISSPITAFVADRCEVGVNGMIERGALYARYIEWAEEEGIKPYGKAKFGQALRSAFPAVGDERINSYGARTRHYTKIRFAYNTEEHDLIA